MDIAATTDPAILTPSSMATNEKASAASSHTERMNLGSDRSPTPTPPEQQQKSTPISKPILPSSLWQLIDVYYAYTHCWLPIVEKQNLLKVAYSYPDDGLGINLKEAGSGNHAELWSVLALASFQAMSADLMREEKIVSDIP
jgi:hypothetical protein